MDTKVNTPMEIIKFLKHPRVYIQNKANKIAENKIKQLNFISITETNDEDIFIAGFPKSGNTWMQNLVSSILLESTSQRITPRLVNELVPDIHFKKYYKRFFPVMFFKTHDLPKPRYKKVIHLVRDGRDAMVSYFKMGINQNKNFPYSLKDMVVEGKGVYPAKWHIHTREWAHNPYKAKIITLQYEELLRNPLMELKKVCDFANIVVSDEFLLKVINGNSIEKLRSKVSLFGTDNESVFKNKPVSSFFRKGEIGNYKKEMDEELITFFNKEAREELLKYGYLL